MGLLGWILIFLPAAASFYFFWKGRRCLKENQRPIGVFLIILGIGFLLSSASAILTFYFWNKNQPGAGQSSVPSP